MPDDLLDPRLAAGDNQPPPDPIDTLLAPLRADFALWGHEEIPNRVAEIVRAANAWMTDVKEITSDDFGPKVEDFLKQIRDETQALDATRKALNKPHDDAIKAHNDAFRPIGALFEAAVTGLKKIKAMCLAYDEKKKAAAAASAAAEAKRLAEAAEAAKALAAAPTEIPVEAAVMADQAVKAAEEAATVAASAQRAKPALVGNYTGRASGYRTVWKARITNPAKALIYYQKHAKLLEVLQSLANADAKTMKEACDIPGIEAYSEQTV